MTGQLVSGWKRLWLLTALLAAFSAAAVACSDTGDRSGLTGTINVDGSSTVFPITQAVAEEFRADGNNGVQIPIGVSGTGGGMKRFTSGEIAISNASRKIRDSEVEKARENGVDFVELRVALDGLSVLVNPKNDFVSCLTTAELEKIWMPGSTVKRWVEVRDEFPDKKIRLYGPGTDSGTFDYFTDEINGAEGATRVDYTPSEDDNVLVKGISGDANSLGYFGYAYYKQNTERLKLVAIDGGNGCVLPTDETINDGSYTPLSRPLYIYVNRAELEKPEVMAFVEFYMNNAALLALEVGYVPLPENVYQENLALIR